MKKSIKNIALTAFAVVAVSVSAFAQERPKLDNRPEKHHTLNLSEKQKAMMKKGRENQQAFRKSFEATFNNKQKKIMEDRSLNPKEKRQALEKTFSSKQQKMIAQNREEAKKHREQFMNSLSKEQKESFAKGKGRKDSHHFQGNRKGGDRKDFKKKDS